MIKALYIGQNQAQAQTLAKAVDSVTQLEHSVELLANRAYLEAVQLVVVEKDIKGTPLTCLRDLTVSNGLDSKVPIIVVGDAFSKSEKVELLRSGISELAQPTSNLVPALRQLLSIDSNTLNTNHVDIQRISWIKRAFDIAFASACLILLAPIMIIIALLIKIDSRGPLVYKSKRVGRAYQVFDFLKFRTMKVNADSLVSDMATENQYANEESDLAATSSNEFLIDAMGNTIDEETFLASQKADKGGAFFKVKNDPRITNVGRFLRATSLDELPQFVNVLRGEMSIIGNRPLPLYEAEQLTTDQWVTRFMAPAGITGLWQIEKRGKSDMSETERKELDNTYVKKQSFWYDMSILVKTIPALLQKENV